MPNHAGLDRRAILTGVAASTLSALARPAFAVPKTIRIGLVAPLTGPLAAFTEHIPFTLDQVKKVHAGSLKVNGTAHPYEILVKDSQSSPNRASEVALELILKNRATIVCAFATPETVNPVADQCELNGVPCLSNDCPLEPYFFGRHGDPKKGFDWTYNFFFSGDQVFQGALAMWNKVPTNRKVGVLWPNDVDGNTFAKVIPPLVDRVGYSVIDPGRFDLPANDFSAQISAFKGNNAEVTSSVLPPPDFTTFWNQAAQQGYHPKVAFGGKSCEFPPPMYALGDRAANISVEVWWSRHHPFASGMTGQSSAELADQYEKLSGQQASMALGFRHALFEVCFDVLKRAQDLDRPAAVRDALRATSYKSVVGPINFTAGPFPNTCVTPAVMGQWRKGTKWPVELVIVDNTFNPVVPLGGYPEPIAS